VIYRPSRMNVVGDEGDHLGTSKTDARVLDHLSDVFTPRNPPVNPHNGSP